MEPRRSGRACSLRRDALYTIPVRVGARHAVPSSSRRVRGGLAAVAVERRRAAALTRRPPAEPHRTFGAVGTPVKSLGEGEDHGLVGEAMGRDGEVKRDG